VLVGPNGVRSPPVNALVDSGASQSLFPKDLATQWLGVRIEECEEVAGMDAAGGSLRWLHPGPITAHLEGLDRAVSLRATLGLAPIVLLGREDFFAAFRQIAFNENGQFFTISE
jgi:hypothetical protein